MRLTSQLGGKSYKVISLFPTSTDLKKIKIERILCLPVLSFFLIEAGNFFSTWHIIDVKIRTGLLVFTWNYMHDNNSGSVTAVFTLPMPVCICSNFKRINEDGLILLDWMVRAKTQERQHCNFDNCGKPPSSAIFSSLSISPWYEKLEIWNDSNKNL